MKKTNKENPITTFRKLNEARKGTIMKSLKKAQDGIGVNDTMNDDMINKAGSTGGYKTPTPTWSVKDVASMATAFANSNPGANVERTNAILRDPARGVTNSLSNAQQLEMINREEINRMNTTPKTGIPPSNEELNYIKLRQEAINNKGAKNGGIMKKGGTHKMPNGKVMLNSKMKTGGVVKKKYDEGGEIDPRNKKYNKFKGDPTSTVSKVGDKSIKFDTSDAGKTYTKTIYKKVTANRAQNASPEKRWGDDEIKKTKIISGKAATRQANRLAKKIENQPGTYQKMGGITKTTVVNRIGGVKKMQVKRNKKC